MTITLNNVSKEYKNKLALQPLDLTFPSFTITSLIGPSGCGKSTILRIINGLIKPTTGQVNYDGTILDSTNILEFRQQMGYVIQDGGLFPHLSIQENICLMAKHLKYSNTQIQQKLNELIELTSFPKEALKRYPNELSGGQLQRASLMRALMLNPNILLLDEPLGALDPLVRNSLQKDLKQIFTSLKKTVILVTHDMNEAAYFGDSIVLLKNGKLVQQGTINELLHKPAEDFVSDFITVQRSIF